MSDLSNFQSLLVDRALRRVTTLVTMFCESHFLGVTTSIPVRMSVYGMFFGIYNLGYTERYRVLCIVFDCLFQEAWWQHGLI